ncbi:RTA1 domain-containing protein, partial [Aspergillus homomorphus CBS 101889]
MAIYQLYHYAPSLAAAIAATASFGLLTTCHAIHYLAQRTWFFTPFVIGGIFETTGYAARIINSQQTLHWSTAPYIIQSLLILIAPSLFAASIYVILARIIRLTNGDTRSPLRANRITRIFVIGDVIAFLAQAGGGGLLARSTSSSTTHLANWIVIAGLIVQILFLAAFMCVLGVFHRRMARHPTRRARRTRVPWWRFLWVLYVVSGCVLGRSVFRVVEFACGAEGVLQRREVWLYVLDGGLMGVVMGVLLVWHPSRMRDGGGE